MSGVGSSTISGTPSCFLSLPGAACFGRKSATAAAITTTSASARAVTASSICSAVSTGSTSTPGGAGSSTVLTSTTRAPRAAASDAIAYPCLPELRLAITRTASIGSRVPPAVTTTVAPARSPGPRIRSAAATMSTGSASRPAPMSPPASRPTVGSTTWTPRRRSVSRFSTTAGCSHISVCIAGHSSTGARVASSVFVSRSVARPVA